MFGGGYYPLRIPLAQYIGMHNRCLEAIRLEVSAPWLEPVGTPWSFIDPDFLGATAAAAWVYGLLVSHHVLSGKLSHSYGTSPFECEKDM